MSAAKVLGLGPNQFQICCPRARRLKQRLLQQNLPQAD
jgi:hypothetical protein